MRWVLMAERLSSAHTRQTNFGNEHSSENFMSFETIIGQPRVKSLLTRMLISRRLPHALLFHGPEGVGKAAMALELAKALFCQQDDLYCNRCSDCRRVAQLSHPDLMVIFPAPKQPKVEELQMVRQSLAQQPYHRYQPWANPFILIEMIRELKKAVALTSYENKGRVIIILDCHRMTVEAANSLLKVLEEPLGKTTLILVSSQLNLLLPTIVSRCQQVRFDPLTWEVIETALIEREQLSPERARLYARMCFGNYRRALELATENIQERQELMLNILRKVLLSDLEILQLVEQLVQQEDRKTVKELLQLMVVWFRDAMLLSLHPKQSEAGEKVINIDRLPTLDKFINSLVAIDYERVIGRIENAIEYLDRNVYLNVILLELLFELKKHLRRKTHV